MKYTKKLSSSKSKVIRKSKSRRYGGGKKENNYAPTLVTQTAGSPIGYNTLLSGAQSGGLAPAAYNTSYTDVYKAMSNFGKSILLLSNLAQNNYNATLNHSNAAVTENTNATNLDLAGSNLMNSFLGVVSATNPTNVYQTILNGTTPPPKPPASAPSAV